MSIERDPYNVWNGEKFQFTLNKLCQVIYGDNNYSIPEVFSDIADKPIERIAADNMPVKSGLRVVFDLSWNVAEEESYAKISNFLKDGIVIFTNRNYSDAQGNPYPVFKVQDPWESWIALGQYVKGVFPMPTIGLTGSAGKTTSTMFAECVFNEKFNTFISGLNGGNYNTPLSIVGQWILRAGPQYTFHAQECGGETIDLIETSAKIINVDGFGITNIDTSQHIATYETPENLIRDKTSFDRVRKADTFAVINLDDAVLRSHQFQSPVISFAIEDQSADYVGQNIVQNGELLEFDVVSKTEEPVHIQIHIIGKHNVYNALMIFAFAKKFGLTNEEIQRGFFKYESVGIRQYLRRVGGRLLFMDAYNASVESTQLSIQALEELVIPEGGRRIAIIGERKTSNEETFNINFDLGCKLAKFDKIDEFIIVGESNPEQPEYSHVMYDGARSKISDPRRLSYTQSKKELAERLRYQTRPGDAILFKGRHHWALWEIADIAFGTSYFAPPIGRHQDIKTKLYHGKAYSGLDGVNLLSAAGNTKIILPTRLSGKPVVRIGDEAFANNNRLRKIIFGAKLRSVGNSAFANCIYLEQIELPKSCMYIGYNAFEACQSMIWANMLGVTHISKEAFKGCTNLRRVILSEKCTTIEADAFENCPNLSIYAPVDSYAANWASEHNIPFVEIDSSEELLKLAQNGTRLHPNVYGIKKYDNTVEHTVTAPSDGNVASVSILATGDIMVHDDLLKCCYDSNTGIYDFSRLFDNTERYIQSADLAIGNLVTVLGHGSFTGSKNFNTPDEIADALACAGFDAIVSANSHSYDMKYAGIVRTKKILNRCGLAVAGTRSNPAEKAYTIVERNGIKIAILNFTQRTPAANGQKTLNANVLDAQSASLINTFCYETLDADLYRVANEIKSARRDGADVVLVYYYWGGEFDRQSNALQKYIAHRTAEMGADAILGSKSHVLQEMAHITVTIDGQKKTVPVFYGLGNYSWADSLPYTGRETIHNGVLAHLNLSFDLINRKILSIKADYKPLHIKADCVAGKFDYSILSLDDMTDMEIESFNLYSQLSINEIRNAIAESMHGGMRASQFFVDTDHVLEVPIDGSVFVTESILSNGVVTSFDNENALVASVNKDGKIIGHSEGYTIMAALHKNATKTFFCVRATGSQKSALPLVVDRMNAVPVTYRPNSLVTGSEYMLPAGIALEHSTAEAWLRMVHSAESDNIYIRCVGGYRTYEGQLRKTIEYASVFGEKMAKSRHAALGRSEHHLGTSIDVTNVDEGENQCSREAAYQWLRQNAYKFGFIFRISRRVMHMHLRYVDNCDLAKLLSDKKMDIASYVSDYEKINKLLPNNRDWENNFLSPEQVNVSETQWNQLTLRRICKLIGIPVPVGYKHIQDRIVPSITMSDLNVVPGSIFFYDKGLKNVANKCRNALRKGAVLAITDTPITDEMGNLLPQIMVDNSFNACVAVGRHLRKMQKAKVIAIEEKPDRRILRNILVEVLSPKFNIHKNKRSVDNRINTLAAIQDLQPEHHIYLQNIRGVSPRYISKNVDMLAPDIAVITPIIGSFPKGYGSLQRYEKDYRTLAEKTIAAGMVFVDFADPLMKEFIIHKNTVTYSSKNRQADYYLLNQEVKGEMVEFTVVRKRDQAKIVQRLPVVYSKSPSYAVAAVAVADKLN